ncbi:MAG: hypothetical protein ACLTOX_01800 [Streptococcus thermophilus]
MLEERPEVTKVGKNSFLIRNRHHLEALIQKFETRPVPVASTFHPATKVLLLLLFLFSVGISRNLSVLWILGLVLGFGVFLPHSILVRTLNHFIISLDNYLLPILFSGEQPSFF